MLNSILIPGENLQETVDKSKQAVKKELEAMLCGGELKQRGTFLL